jgi:circadian clock protein KaiC
LTHPHVRDYFDFSVDAVSSLADTWIRLTNDHTDGSRTRTLSIVKSRGMGHSNEKNEFTITEKGIRFNKKNKTHNRN